MAHPYPTGTFTLPETPSFLGAITLRLSIIHISDVGVWAQPKCLIYCVNFKTFLIATVRHKYLMKGTLVTYV